MPAWGVRRRQKRPTPEMDWREELVEMLILAGTTGLKQNAIVKRFTNWVMADDLMIELDALATMKKVQKFIVKKPKGRPATLWRATTLILKPDQDFVCDSHSAEND